MGNKEHLSTKGMEEVISLVSRMNSKRSFESKYEYCNKSLGLTIDNNGYFYTKFELPPY